MKTNLTTKQIKKIQNGKLAIFKDIDTADAREYLLNVLEWLFPNDKDAKKQRAVEVGLYFYAFCDTTWCHNEKVELKAINLSQIMYTYNPEQFKPISMPCTEEQWNNDLKPIVEAFGIYFGRVNCWGGEVNTIACKLYSVLEVFTTHDSDRDKFNFIPTYSPAEFLEACGIVRADKVDLSGAFKVHYIITPDQIKTARTNPETLEELFPKVFEKPVVEVGKWWHIKSKSNFEYKFYITKNENGQLYGYGFDEESVWHNENPLIREHVIESATLCNLSDLQPLFEAEFNKRYKEGNLLGSPHSGAEFEYRAKDVEYDQLLSNVSYICHFCIFKNGNFAKVIKSAELIKAEEELEQAKKRVESLKNR